MRRVITVADPSPLYVATFIDLIPPGTEAGTAAIKQYVLDTRKEPGIVRCEAIAQVAGRVNHLMVMEVWKEEAADFNSRAGPVR
jgi:quinol monooxygenase YgiN